ncbi:MAG: diguanylate cyclase domain-containing protein [Halomonas sp.]
MGEGHLTLSIGVAEYRCKEPLTSLIGLADQALYSAKSGGHDCGLLRR